MPRPQSAAEEAFAWLLSTEDGIPDPVRELEFHPTRKWRLDFAWPEQMVAVEIEGVTGGREPLGRHQRAGEFEKDCEKYEAALELGWTVYRIPARWVYARKRIQRRARTFEVLRKLLGL